MFRQLFNIFDITVLFQHAVGEEWKKAQGRRLTTRVTRFQLWWQRCIVYTMPRSRWSSTNTGILATCNNCLSGLCWANTSVNVTVCLFSTREESFCSCFWATSTRKWQRTQRARQLTHQDEKTCGSKCVFTATYSLFSLLSLSFSQALASHRAYLLTARIPAKVRNSNSLEFHYFFPGRKYNENQ